MLTREGAEKIVRGGILRHGEPRLEEYKGRLWLWALRCRREAREGVPGADIACDLARKSIAVLTPPIREKGA